MKRSLIILLIVANLVLFGAIAMATEEAEYDVIVRDGKFELRHYAPKVVAETVLEGDFDKVGNVAFKRLAGYIFGGNETTTKFAMTAPVGLEVVNKKTTESNLGGQAVSTPQRADSWRVTFVMPSEYSLETLPKPNDHRVFLRTEPGLTMAALRYSGSWSQTRYHKHETKLLSWIKQRGLKVAGEPVFARYNSPFALWFLRRNEVLVPVEPEPLQTTDRG